MSYHVETCADVWRVRSLHPTKAEAYDELDRLVRVEHWGTLSIRVVPAPGLRSVTSKEHVSL
jgi:hypothetical protein